MIIMRFCFVVITALLMTAFGGVEPAAAEELLTYFVRELVIQSDEIVVARPAVPGRIVGKNVRFVVSEVLQGRRIVAGETITVADLSYYHLGEPPFFRRPSAARPPSCDKALLFLNPKRTRRGQQEVDCEFDLYESGMRLLTGDAKVLLPLQFINPGDYYFVVAKDATWKALLAKVKGDIKAVSAVFAIRATADPARRNQALFEWIDKHQAEFNGLYFMGHDQAPQRGWASLEHSVFQWILDGGRPDDAWHAVKLWRKVAQHPFGVGPLGKPDAFASSEGRRILLHAAMDADEPLEDRQSAVYRLAMSLYNKPPEQRQIAREEHRQLNAAALALLEHDDRQMRRFASELARGLELQKAALRIDPRPRKTLDAMIAAYRRQSPGRGRTEMAANIIAVGGEDVWRQVSGNPDKILVHLQNVQLRRDQRGKVIHFDVFQSIHQRARDRFKIGLLVAALEKLDVVEPGEGHRLPLVSFGSASSGDSGPWVAEVSADTLSPGRWRMTLVGKTARGEDEWRSEPAVVEME